MFNDITAWGILVIVLLVLLITGGAQLRTEHAIINLTLAPKKDAFDERDEAFRAVSLKYGLLYAVLAFIWLIFVLAGRATSSLTDAINGVGALVAVSVGIAYFAVMVHFLIEANQRLKTERAISLRRTTFSKESTPA